MKAQKDVSFKWMQMAKRLELLPFLLGHVELVLSWTIFIVDLFGWKVSLFFPLCAGALVRTKDSPWNWARMVAETLFYTPTSCRVLLICLWEKLLSLESIIWRSSNSLKALSWREIADLNYLSWSKNTLRSSFYAPSPLMSLELIPSSYRKTILLESSVVKHWKRSMTIMHDSQCGHSCGWGQACACEGLHEFNFPAWVPQHNAIQKKIR